MVVVVRKLRNGRGRTVRIVDGYADLTAEGMTAVPVEAFVGCKYLKSVVVGGSIKMICDFAFHNCPSLQSVTMGDSVETIDENAFSQCGSLQSVTMGDSVKTINDYAFAHCKSLHSVTMGDSVETIGDQAFGGRSSLQSVTIPATATYTKTGKTDHFGIDCGSFDSHTTVTRRR